MSSAEQAYKKPRKSASRCAPLCQAVSRGLQRLTMCKTDFRSTARSREPLHKSPSDQIVNVEEVCTVCVSFKCNSM
jgi:hypothetical protein